MKDNYKLGIYNSYSIREGVNLNELIDFLESQGVPKNYYLRHIEHDEFSGFFRNDQFAHLKFELMPKYLKCKTYKNGILLKINGIPNYLKNYY